MRRFLQLLLHELKLNSRQASRIYHGFGTSILLLLLLPLMLTKTDSLPEITHPILWLGTILAAVNCGQRLFEEDIQDGTYEIMAQRPWLLERSVAAKQTALWLTLFPGTLALIPLAIIFCDGNWNEIKNIISILAVQLWVTLALSALLASLTSAIPERGGLILLLLLPLITPVVLIAQGSILSASTTHAVLALLGLACIYTPTAIWGCGAIIRGSIRNKP